MMKKVFFISMMIVAFNATNLFSQELPPEWKVVRPKFIQQQEQEYDWKNNNYSSYQDYVISQIKSGRYLSSVPKNEQIWVAFSDRENNTTYSSNNKSSIYSKLDYMEKVYIADISSGWALIFSDDINNHNDKKIKRTAKPRGWIPVENLLLWYQCPKNDRNILEKGLVVLDLEKMSGASQKIQFLSSPSQNSTFRGDATQLDVFFVMKKTTIDEKVYYLLSRDATVNLDGYNQKGTILGWLSEDHLTLWDQRLCLEPVHENKFNQCLSNRKAYRMKKESLKQCKIWDKKKIFYYGKRFWLGDNSRLFRKT